MITLALEKLVLGGFWGCWPKIRMKVNVRLLNRFRQEGEMHRHIECRIWRVRSSERRITFCEFFYSLILFTINEKSVVRVAKTAHRNKIWGIFIRGVILTHHNKTPHTAILTSWETLEHPHYCLDLFPCDHFLLTPLKEPPKGKRLAIAKTDEQEILMLPNPWQNCVDCTGDRKLHCLHVLKRTTWKNIFAIPKSKI